MQVWNLSGRSVSSDMLELTSLRKGLHEFVMRETTICFVSLDLNTVYLSHIAKYLSHGDLRP